MDFLPKCQFSGRLRVTGMSKTGADFTAGPGVYRQRSPPHARQIQPAYGRGEMVLLINRESLISCFAAVFCLAGGDCLREAVVGGGFQTDQSEVGGHGFAFDVNEAAQEVIVGD